MIIILSAACLIVWHARRENIDVSTPSVLIRKKVPNKLVLNSAQVKLENKQIVKTQELEEPFNTLEIPNPQKNPNSKDEIEKKESKYKDWVEWSDIFFNTVNSRLEVTKIQK
jgi:hypothetical protein